MLFPEDSERLTTEPEHSTEDPDTGELLDSTTYGELVDLVKGQRREIRYLNRQLADLKRDKEAEMLASKEYEAVLRIFKYWQKECRHPRSKMDRVRFDAIRKFLLSHGEDHCLMAIEGIAAFAYVRTLDDGSKEKYDSVTLIFRDNDHFERYCNRGAQARKRKGANK